MRFAHPAKRQRHQGDRKEHKMLTNNKTTSNDPMIAAFPINSVVENLGHKAVVIGYRDSGNLILRGNMAAGQVANWLADPDKCIRIA